MNTAFIQSQFKNSTYFILISVWDYMTIMRPIPSALVKFKTPLFDTITNTANLGGKTDITVFGEKTTTRELYNGIRFPRLFNRNNNRINWTGDWCNILTFVPKYT